jgi:hypothetical protein
VWDMTGVGDDSRGRLLGRPWLVVGFVLAVGATLALVLSNDPRFLRLAIVAALWAALIGAFLAVKYRKHAGNSEDAVAEAQAVYELELEREVAARREFELEIEAEARQQSEVESRTELDALRAEIAGLRESLQSLFGGEVLYEHVALTAQATRMRSIKDERLVTSSESNGKPAPAQLMAGKKTVNGNTVNGNNEHPTEFMDRVREQASAAKSMDNRRPAQSPQRSQQAPIRPRQVEEPVRRVSQGDGAGAAAARAAKAAADLRAEANRRQQQPPVRPQQSQAMPVQATAQVKPVHNGAQHNGTQQSRPRTETEYTRPEMDRVERSRPAASAAPSAGAAAAKGGPGTGEQPAATTREQQLAELGKAWKPSWKKDPTRNNMKPVSRTNMKPVADPKKGSASRTNITPVTDPKKGTASRTGMAPVPDPKKFPGSRTGITPVTDPKKFPGSRTGMAPVADPTKLPGSRTNIEPVVDPKAFPRSRSGISPVADPRKKAEDAPAARHGSHRPIGEQSLPSMPAAHIEFEKSLPEVIREAQELASGGGRRRRTSDEASYSSPATTPVPAASSYSEPETPPSGGRRRRPENEPPPWQTTEPEPAHGSRHSTNGSNAATNGSHSRPSSEPPANGGSNGRRAASAHSGRYEAESAEAGSHAAGRSVNELLASLGASDSTPRRRRRAED